MEKVAHKITCYLLKCGIITNANLAVYQYGLHIGLELIVCILFCVLFSLPLEMFWESILFFIVFFLLRSYVGGIHLSSYYQCFLLSVIVHFSVLLFTKYFEINSLNISLSVITITNLLLILIKPVENENREVNEEEKKAFEKIKRRHIVFIQLLVVLLYALNMKRFLTLVCYTLLTIILSMVLGNVVKRKSK